MHAENVSGPHTFLCNQRILIVEDEAIVAMMVEDALADAGAAVLGSAATVCEALALIAQTDGKLGAAVLDLNLNGKKVFPVADRLAALGVPFLFASGYGDDCDKGGHASVPMLQKPFEPERLVTAVEALIAGKADLLARPALAEARAARGGWRSGAGDGRRPVA